jgi:aminopeptidase N
MKKRISFILLFTALFLFKAQDYSGYNPSATIINDLVHTKLKVRFDIPNEKLFGEAWITLKPHFYPTDSLTLDAKGMEIATVTLDGGKALKYNYKDSKLKINLGKTYKKDESYTIYIKYTAIPSTVTQKGSAAISAAKGLYFINPKGEEEDKPTQIWTQGETESGSCWFPTIDKPNQKTSQEIYITVPDKYITLSNGLLKTQTKNSDGTRTDYWNMDKKHAPYLFFMGIGDFAVVKDKWKDISVDYYVEKEYEPYAKAIFGYTPEMMQFYSDILKYPYPWSKYSQIAGRDYVSGAMENTTATIHAENAQQKPGQLIDANIWETIIAHELFHHWFGDLVTTESWANLTVNESFANYSEYLWLEYKYGKDRAESHKEEEKEGYLFGGDNFAKDLVRFQYKDKEDVFDNVSYNKGGIILHMLRNYLGDDAFFAGLTKYLTENQYKTAEAHNLRLAWEEVSGKDLNWFFNQWYFGNGHPKLKVTYSYDSKKKVVKAGIIQTQEPKFQFPLDIDVYENGKAIRHKVWVKALETNTFELPYKSTPQLVNINPDDVLLSEITDDDKTTSQYLFQYKNAPEYHSRKEALEKLADVQTSNSQALETLLQAASSDKFEGLRKLAVSLLKEENTEVQKKSVPILEKVAASDSKTLVRAEAIKKLGKINAKKYIDLFKKLSAGESYAVKSACINALLTVDQTAAANIVSSIDDKDLGGDLTISVVNVAVATQDVSKLPLISKNVINIFLRAESQEDADRAFAAVGFIMSGDYPKETKTVVDSFVKLYPRAKRYNYGEIVLQIMQGALQMKQRASNSSPSSQSLKDQVKYITDGLTKMK